MDARRVARRGASARRGARPEVGGGFDHDEPRQGGGAHTSHFVRGRRPHAPTRPANMKPGRDGGVAETK